MTKTPRQGSPRIRALFFDVDGVLTDGRVYIDDQGHESKVFDTKDGHGVKMAVALVARKIKRTPAAIRQRIKRASKK